MAIPERQTKEFKETLKLINEIKFINTYSYIFSARPGTPAFNLKQMNQLDIKKRLIDFQFEAKKIKQTIEKNSLIRLQLFYLKIK